MRGAVLCVLVVLISCAVSSPILGVYTGGGSPALMPSFSQFAGHDVNLALDFLSLDSWPGLQGDPAQFQAWASWLNAKSGRWFVLSIAMIPNSGGGDLQTGANGGYNSTWSALGRSLINNGLRNNVILRIGWEMNGNWYPWQAGKNPTAWVKYFQVMVDILRGINPAFKILWNVQVNWTPTDGTTVYPGSEYVDYIGVDVYDTCYDSHVGCPAYLSGRAEGGTWTAGATYAANTLVDWAGAFYVNSRQSKGEQPGSGGSPWSVAFDSSTLQSSRSNTFNNLVNGYAGLAGWANFAKSKGRPLSIPEFGVFLTQNGGGDDAYYIESMYNWVNNPANNVAWVSYWDYGEQRLSPAPGGVQPSVNAANAFKKTFGSLP